VIHRLCVVLAALLVAACAQVPTSNPDLVGYYAGWNGVVPIDMSRLSAINYSFLALRGDGSVAVANPGAEEPVLAYLRSQKAARPGQLLFASVGGWTGSGGFSDMAHDHAARERFIVSSLEFLRRNGFDGIDIDWEYPGAIGAGCGAGATCDRPSDKEDFVRLAREMRTAFDAAGAADGHHYRLTIAAGADGKFAANATGPWLARLAASLDWVNLMSYDYHGTWERTANFVAPLRTEAGSPEGGSVDSSVSLFIAEGVPAEKLVLGVPFYGKGWAGCAPGPRGGLYQPCAELARPDHEATFEFAWLEDQGYLAQDASGELAVPGRGFARAWNAAASEPSLFDAASGTFIAYDDERSMREKARYAKDRGLRGVMFWELTADRHGELARALASELGR
jgi:chitinase